MTDMNPLPDLEQAQHEATDSSETLTAQSTSRRKRPSRHADTTDGGMASLLNGVDSSSQQAARQMQMQQMQQVPLIDQPAFNSSYPPGRVREQLRLLLKTVKSVRQGDFSVRMPQFDEDDGIISDIGEVLNDIIEMNENMASEFVRVGSIVGQEGRMTERVSLGSVRGAWKTSMDSINGLIGDLVQPTTEAARVITAVAIGDLSQKMVLEIDGRPLKGEFARIGRTVNSMVDQLSSFASEVTRVAKEVGTEGKLGGQAEVKAA